MLSQEILTMAIMLFGHRGAAGEAPENTLVGFAYAFRSAQVRCFEFDVHLTKDSRLAVIHDGIIDRTTNGKGEIGMYTLDELKQFDAGVQFGRRFSGAVIPSLEEVLDIYAGEIASFQIEIKTDTQEVLDVVVAKLLDTIQTYQISEKTVVTSFDAYALRRVLKTNPSQKCGFIAMNYTENDLLTAVDLGCFNTCIPLTSPDGKELVTQAQSKGLQTTGWLGNSSQDIDILLDWNVDSITSNYPTSIRNYLCNVKHEIVV